MGPEVTWRGQSRDWDSSGAPQSALCLKQTPEAGLCAFTGLSPTSLFYILVSGILLLLLSLAQMVCWLTLDKARVLVVENFISALDPSGKKMLPVCPPFSPNSG